MSIKPKKKPCKGQNKAKGFPGCGELVLNRKYGLCLQCLREWAHSTGEGQEYIRKQIIPKAKKEVKRKQKEQDQAAKDKLTDWKDKLQTEVQKIARYIDYGLPCLARDYVPNQMHGGHIFSKGAYSNIRFNLHNIHRQSAQSNHFQNEDGLLREKLELEYGSEYFEMLSALRQTKQPKYSNLEYKEFYDKAKEISKRLNRENNVMLSPRPVKLRIRLRDHINQELGIYQPLHSLNS